MTLKSQLQADLKLNRYTLSDLAKEAGHTNTHVYAILNGKIEPTLKASICLSYAANRLTESTTYTPDMFFTIIKELNQ
jgi:hypothetical protein